MCIYIYTRTNTHTHLTHTEHSALSSCCLVEWNIYFVFFFVFCVVVFHAHFTQFVICIFNKLYFYIYIYVIFICVHVHIAQFNTPPQCEDVHTFSLECSTSTNHRHSRIFQFVRVSTLASLQPNDIRCFWNTVLVSGLVSMSANCSSVLMLQSLTTFSFTIYLVQ